jgi:hypothetical protein
MLILKIVAGIFLLGGASWTMVRTYKGRGRSSWLTLVFAIFLVALGSYFLVDAFAEYLREFRVDSDWVK